MVNTTNLKYFCNEDISKIENYELAMADTTQTWHCHHRLETHTSDGIKREVGLSVNELKELGLYFHRPASELILLTRSEHQKLHRKGSKLSAETKKKLSESLKKRYDGKPLPLEVRQKLSKKLKGTRTKVKERTYFAKHFLDSGLSDYMIAKRMREAGLPIGRTTIFRWKEDYKKLPELFTSLL